MDNNSVSSAQLTAKEIVDIYIDNGLIQRCVDYQFSAVKDKSVQQFKADFFQDLVVILYTYDIEKLQDAHENNHMNALITRIIQNNLWSTTSPFYRTYRKFDRRTEDLTKMIEDEG